MGAWVLNARTRPEDVLRAPRNPPTGRPALSPTRDGSAVRAGTHVLTHVLTDRDVQAGCKRSEYVDRIQPCERDKECRDSKPDHGDREKACRPVQESLDVSPLPPRAWESGAQSQQAKHDAKN